MQIVPENILTELRAGILPVISARVDLKKKGKEYVGLCPLHSESTPSFFVNESKAVFYCQGCNAKGDVFSFIQQLDGADFPTALRVVAGELRVTLDDAPYKPANPEIVATYTFNDADGNFLYEKCRFEPGFVGSNNKQPRKSFAYRRKDSEGRWIWGLDAGDYVLNGKNEWRKAKKDEQAQQTFPKMAKVMYRLPEWCNSDKGVWHFLTEGEKHADLLRSWGLTAANFGDLTKSDWCLISKRKIVWLPDNDEAGRKKLIRIYADFKKHAEQSVIIELPRLAEKEDVIEWVSKRNGTKEELLALVEANENKDTLAAFMPDSIIDIYFTGDLAQQSNAAWQAIKVANDPPHLFQRDGIALRLEITADDLYLRPLLADKMRYEIARAMSWTKKGASVAPPREVAIDMLAANPLPLPVINRVVRVPVYSASGKLSTQSGYDPNTANYLAFDEHYESLEVSPVPCESEVRKAKELICDNILIDFPFVSNADKTNAFAMFLSPFVRDMVKGPTPCFLIDSSTNGSGKSLLAECLLYPAQNKMPGNSSEVGDSSEMEKTLSSLLMQRDPVIFLDNINSKVSSGILANYLTATRKNCRVLGKSVIVDLPVHTTWVMTGANVELSNENARRVVYVRLVPESATPEARTGFKHEFIKEWVKENSSKLAWAAHTLIQNWIAKGQPKPACKPMGSYEHWHLIVGGILESAGIENFLGNLKELQENANTERKSWSEFIDHWWTNFGTEPQPAHELLSVAEMFDGIDINGNNDRARQTSFAMQLTKQRDRYFTPELLCIKKAQRTTCQYWKLEKHQIS